MRSLVDRIVLQTSTFGLLQVADERADFLLGCFTVGVETVELLLVDIGLVQRDVAVGLNFASRTVRDREELNELFVAPSLMVTRYTLPTTCN